MKTFSKAWNKTEQRTKAWLLSMSRYIVIVNLDGKRIVHNSHSVLDGVIWLSCYDSTVSGVVVDTWLGVTVAGRRGVA